MNSERNYTDIDVEVIAPKPEEIEAAFEEFGSATRPDTQPPQISKATAAKLADYAMRDPQKS